MKLRAAFGVLAVAVTISACGGSPAPAGTSGGGGAGSGSAASSPSSGASGSSAGDAAPVDATSGDFCARLQAAEDKLDNFNDSVGDGDMAGAGKAIAADIAVFRELAQGAPAEVKPALTDIVQLLEGARGALTNPGSQNVAALQDLATKLPTDLNTMGNYMANNCSS